jgi:dienelactone hydrolase
VSRTGCTPRAAEVPLEIHQDNGDPTRVEVQQLLHPGLVSSIHASILHRTAPPGLCYEMIMVDTYVHLGPFGDLVEVASRLGVRPRAGRSRLDSAAVRRVIGFDHDASPLDPRTEERWSRDGVDGEEVSWSVGYGPRTRAWYLRPSGVAGPLPGVLALHGHDAFKFYGREKIADGPHGVAPGLEALRRKMYQNRPFANDLARRGFAVLVADAFLWGSRRFEADVMPAPTSPPPEDLWIAAEGGGDPGDIRWYNRLAARHEHVVAKYCTLLGTSLAGIVAYEDRIAAAYLASRADVRPNGLGCVGLSGGGCRAALLHATSERIRAAVVVGMMSTHRALLDRHVANHTWMFFPPGLPGIGDWPDLAACRAPSPLMVQYLLDDALFPVAGMRAAHDRLADEYEHSGAAEAYVGEFYPGPHRFDADMQDSAFTWLAGRLVD